MSEVTWEITSLSELGTFSRGKSKHRPRNDIKLFEGGTYPLVQTGDVKAANLYITKNDSYYNDFGLKQSKLWPAGTLCITIAANIAETAILSYPMCFPDSIVGFNANPEKSSELFVYYFFEYIKKEIQKSASGSIQDNINIDYLSKMRIKVPEKDYQDKIVEVLSSIDKKILLNNQINQELEGMAKTLYDYWFVQFDFPDQNGKPYKSSGGKMVYNPELKREIPEGWGAEKLSSLLKIGKETTNPKKFPNEEFKYYSIPEFDTTGTYSLERGESIKSNKFKVEKNDLLVSKLNPWFNRVIYNLEENAIASTEFIVWKTFNRFEKNFLYQVATGKEFIEYCTRFATGTSNSHKRVSPDIMVGFQIPFEKTHIQKFGEIIDSIRTQVLQNNEQNQELTQLRDWILPMLMNGQVKVE